MRARSRFGCVHVPTGLSVWFAATGRMGWPRASTIAMRHATALTRAGCCSCGATGPDGIEMPVACCCWHVHQGNWPLCVFDAGWSRSLDDAAGIALVEQALFGALRQLGS
jgi:hypothetical protein